MSSLKEDWIDRYCINCARAGYATDDYVLFYAKIRSSFSDSKPSHCYTYSHTPINKDEDPFTKMSNGVIYHCKVNNGFISDQSKDGMYLLHS